MQVLGILLFLATVSHSHPNVTPAPALPTPLLPRQGGSTLADTCGYIEANILSPVGCFAGSICVEQIGLGLAGGCCRLADVSNSNCFLPTTCVPQASLAASCDDACSSNSQITKCDVANPYCYTNYWPAAGSTAIEVGCTTTQGAFAYLYTSYTGFGWDFSPKTAISSPIPPTRPSGTSPSATAGLESSNDQSSNTDSGSSVASDGGSSGDSVNAGAIAGGVVGGVAVLGVAAAIITWLCLRHRRKERNRLSHGNNAPSTSEVSPPVGGTVTRKPVPVQEVVSPVGSAELSHDEIYRPHEAFSTDKTQAHELHGRRVVPEMP